MTNMDQTKSDAHENSNSDEVSGYTDYPTI